MANIVEAYKSVIEFNKTIISITSTVLAALISYLVFQDYSLNLPNIISPSFLVLSLIFSFLGIGNAIPAINVEQSKIWAVRHSNIGAGLMIIGIVTIFFIDKKEKVSIDKALYTIEQTLLKVDSTLLQKNCNRLELIDGNYIFHFKRDSIKRKVIYSVDKDHIISFSAE